jgi:hypothetical protein
LITLKLLRVKSSHQGLATFFVKSLAKSAPRACKALEKIVDHKLETKTKYVELRRKEKLCF